MLSVPITHDSHTLADWTELSLLFGGNNYLSRAEIKRKLEEAFVPDSEEFASNIWIETESRKAIAQQAYPFIINADRIERTTTWRNSFPYSFLTLLSAQSFIDDFIGEGEDRQNTAKIFEKLTSAALNECLGHSIITGSPRSDPLPSDFEELIQYLPQVLFENPRPDPEIPLRAQDDRVDVIAWNQIDTRSGKVMILVNCATGINWKRKESELVVELWDEYIKWPFSPLRAFSLPYVIRDGWFRQSIISGLLLDRLRLAILTPCTKDASIRSEIIEWIQRKKELLTWMD